MTTKVVFPQSVIAIAIALIALTACATVAHDPLYDGAPEMAAPTASATFIRIHVENHRTKDAISPTIYLLGSGRHSLGTVLGMGGKIDRFIDTAWLDPSGCMTISAHYAGSGDLVFDPFCWRPGQWVDVTLDDTFNPVAAWAHR